MRKLYTLSLLSFISISAFCQQTFEIKGKTQLVSYYQGGMELPEDVRSPKSNPNISVIILKYNGPDEYSTIINTITSDDNGDFEINLTEGSYGFVLAGQKNEVKKHKGLFLPLMPKRIEEKDFQNGVGTSDNWGINSGQPFIVNDSSDRNMILTHYNITVCYMCP